MEYVGFGRIVIREYLYRFLWDIPSYQPAKCPALAGTKKEPNSRKQSNRTGFEIQDKNIRLCYEKPGRFFIADDNLSRVFLPAAGYRWLYTCCNPAISGVQNQKSRLQCSGALQEFMVISIVITLFSHV